MGIKAEPEPAASLGDESVNLEETEFSFELRVISMPNCKLERLEDQGRVISLKEYL